METGRTNSFEGEKNMWFKSLREDINAAKRNDPAARNKFEIFLHTRGCTRSPITVLQAFSIGYI